MLNDYDVRLYLHTNAIYVRSYMDNHQWRLVGGGQFMVPENWEDLRKKYGDELPWIRLYFQHRPNRFLISIFAVPTTVLALAGLLFACVEDVRINALLGVCEVLLLTGLHLAITQLVPTCENAPLFGECSSVAILHLLFMLARLYWVLPLIYAFIISHIFSTNILNLNRSMTDSKTSLAIKCDSLLSAQDKGSHSK